jgi:hypothetical protein
VSQRACSTIHDLTGHGGCLVAQCPCGRAAIFSVHSLSALFRAKRWAADIRSVGGRLRCSGCNRRGVRLAYSQESGPPFASLCLVVTPPKGIAPLDWANADERGRKLLVRRARG